MLAPDLPPVVPIYAMWFGSSGALATLLGLVGGRDDVVRKTCQGEHNTRLAKLNEFLSPFARVAQTIEFRQAVLYATIRDEKGFEELRTHVTQVHSAMFWSAATGSLTRGGVLAVVLHFAAGVTVTSLSLGGVLERDAADAAILGPWIVSTVFVVAILLAKATILQARGDSN